MSAEANAALVRRFFDAYNRNQPELYAEVCSPNYICRMGASESVTGLAANLEMEAYFRTAFSDARWDIQDLIATDDKVVVRRTWSMTHTGEFQGIPATGRTVTGTGIDIFRIQDGQLAEQWSESDNLSFMQQLGALPAADHAPGL